MAAIFMHIYIYEIYIYLTADYIQYLFVVVISLFLIGGESFYNIVLFSAIHQHVKPPSHLQPHPTSLSSQRVLS